MPPTSSRGFATAQVHPPYLPTLHKSSRVEKRVAAVAVAAAGIGYGISKYQQHQLDDHPIGSPTSPSSAASASSPSTSSTSSATPWRTSQAYAASSGATLSQAETHMRAEAMRDAYADRGSLAELEAAVLAYESQRK